MSETDTAADGWVATPRLRWEKRAVDAPPTIGFSIANCVLQQWYAPDVPKYMRSDEGEWRDVPLIEAAS